MVVAVYIALCLIWSSTWLAIKYVIDDVPPVTGAAVRFWLASFLFLGFHAVRRIDFPRDWPTRLAIVAWGCPQIGVSYAAVYWAEQHISSGMTALMFATFPFFVAVFSARLIEGEGWTRAKLLGLISGLTGVGIVCFDQWRIASTTAALAVIGVVFATMVCGLSVVYIKRNYSKCDTFALTALQMLGGAIALTVFAFAVESPTAAQWTPRSFGATVYLAVFGSAVAFFGYYWLLKRIEGTTVATITFVTPVLALVLGWLALDESISLSTLFGGVLVLSGVRSVARADKEIAEPNRLQPAGESV